MDRIAFIRNSGRSGTERAALNAARTYHVPITGWCPPRGITDGFPKPPGIRDKYPELREMPADAGADAIEWNVRDSHATLIISPMNAPASLTRMVMPHTTAYVRRVLRISSLDDVRSVNEWLGSLGYGLDLHITGPSEEECPGAYDLARAIIGRILTRSA